jgi:glycosyltransferase involved in cell wall biosynthesis
MKVLQLISSGGFYGAENVVLELATALKKSIGGSAIVGVFENSLSPHIEVAEECKKRGIPCTVFRCKGRIDPKTILNLRKFIKSNNISIVHSHGYKSNLYIYLASCGLKKNLVSTCHNWLGESYKMKFYASLDRFVLRKFNKVVAVSEDVKKILVDSGILPNDIIIIGNGISLERFDLNRPRGLKHELGIPEDAFVIGTVGRISEEKGHEYLLKAAPIIFKSYPKTAILIVGMEI